MQAHPTGQASLKAHLMSPSMASRSCTQAMMGSRHCCSSHWVSLFWVGILASVSQHLLTQTVSEQFDCSMLVKAKRQCQDHPPEVDLRGAACNNDINAQPESRESTLPGGCRGASMTLANVHDCWESSTSLTSISCRQDGVPESKTQHMNSLPKQGCSSQLQCLRA